jgi:hypothetical protein
MAFGIGLGIAQLAAPFLGKIFGGGAPEFGDLTQNTQGTSNMVTDALRQSQDLRGDQISKSRDLEEIDIANARSVGGFDPRLLQQGIDADPGNPFAHLAGIAAQFNDADFGAQAIARRIERENQLLALTNQIASLAPSMNLGIDQLLSNAGQQAGEGTGAGIGGLVAGLGNQATLGTGLGGFLSNLGQGPQIDAPGATDPTGSIGQLPGVTTAPAGGQIMQNAPGATDVSGLVGLQQQSPLIQAILQGLR